MHPYPGSSSLAQAISSIRSQYFNYSGRYAREETLYDQSEDCRPKAVNPCTLYSTTYSRSPFEAVAVFISRDTFSWRTDDSRTFSIKARKRYNCAASALEWGPISIIAIEWMPSRAAVRVHWTAREIRGSQGSCSKLSQKSTGALCAICLGLSYGPKCFNSRANLLSNSSAVTGSTNMNGGMVAPCSSSLTRDDKGNVARTTKGYRQRLRRD